MSNSIQTNVNAVVARENLRVNGEFQSRTIQRLTSGYRINSSGDDAAGLAVANKYRSDITELSQGVRNANDGISTLQILDGGLNNITKTIDRLKTLATQSASDTFTGDRNTLNNEYQALLGEINRQAANVGLGTGSGDAAKYNRNLSVYIGGGGSTQANSQVNVDLSGASSRVDSTSLGLSSSSIKGGGENALTGNSVNASTGTFLAAGTQTLTFNFSDSQVDVTVGTGAGALTGAQVVDQLNTALSSYGVKASIVTDTASSNVGEIQFTGGSKAFTVSAAAASAGSAVITAASTGENTALYRAAGAASFAAPTVAAEALTFAINGQNTVVTLEVAETLDQSVSELNSALNSKGVYAVKNSAGTGIDFQSANSFAVASAGGGTGGVFAADNAAHTVTAPSAAASETGNALLALTSLSTAVSSIGVVQGKIGTGQNKLQYAVQLAQSQITNFSAAESAIRDADVAAEAANLTKAQVLQQASIAALSQANQAPQAVLSLLRG